MRESQIWPFKLEAASATTPCKQSCELFSSCARKKIRWMSLESIAFIEVEFIPLLKLKQNQWIEGCMSQWLVVQVCCSSSLCWFVRNSSKRNDRQTNWTKACSCCLFISPLQPHYGSRLFAWRSPGVCCIVWSDWCVSKVHNKRYGHHAHLRQHARAPCTPTRTCTSNMPCTHTYTRHNQLPSQVRFEHVVFGIFASWHILQHIFD